MLDKLKYQIFNLIKSQEWYSEFSSQTYACLAKLLRQPVSNFQKCPDPEYVALKLKFAAQIQKNERLLKQKPHTADFSCQTEPI